MSETTSASSSSKGAKPVTIGHSLAKMLHVIVNSVMTKFADGIALKTIPNDGTAFETITDILETNSKEKRKVKGLGQIGNDCELLLDHLFKGVIAELETVAFPATGEIAVLSSASDDTYIHFVFMTAIGKGVSPMVMPEEAYQNKFVREIIQMIKDRSVKLANSSTYSDQLFLNFATYIFNFLKNIGFLVAMTLISKGNVKATSVELMNSFATLTISVTAATGKYVRPVNELNGILSGKKGEASVKAQLNKLLSENSEDVQRILEMVKSGSVAGSSANAGTAAANQQVAAAYGVKH